MTDYTQQYCKKHDQHYADFLHACPICVGESMDGIYKGHIDEVKKPKKIIRKAIPKTERS